VNRPPRLYYLIKPLLPRRLQIALRRIRARRIFRHVSPPYIKSGESRSRYHWPESKSSAVLLTHDVETIEGQKSVNALLDIEEQYGVKSNWNFVLDRYPLDMGLVGSLAEAGHEIGLHGLKHDGKLFSSEKIFQERMAVLTRAAGAMCIKGFRSPSLLYDLDLLAKLPFEWDSSIPAWDPFQPQPGGCGNYFPFLVGERCMELPVTLWQDFTLFEELQEHGIDIWKNQIDAICEMNGLINVIIHPDYMTGKRLGYYRELIEYLGSKDLLFSLPGIIAEWARNGSDSR